MGRKQKTKNQPIPVRRALSKLGRDLRDARRRRRISMELLAERTSITRMTLSKIEKGDPGVALGSYANVLYALGMANRLGELADVRTDDIGLELDEEQLPQRIRQPRAKRTNNNDEAE